VVITASHNPKEYNGYKAYWNDGAQMIPPHDTNSIDEVNKISSVDQVKFQAIKENIEIIPDSLEQKYIDEVYALSVSKEAIKRQKDLKIVYTPIHGTGVTLVPPLLAKFGFTNVTVVKEQSEPNGNFPTVVYPNPEEAEALSIALRTAKELDADLLLGTDPDADRVGIAIKNNKNEWQLLNGNQTGSLLFFYLLNAWKESGKLDGNQFIVKTIVTSDIMNKICADYGVECYDVLTGFKYIAGIIKENEGKKTFICGGEESYGYLVGDFVRDKDAVSSVAFIAEMTAYAKDKGTSLFEWMLDMYVKYGFYKEKLISVTKKGKSGADEIKQMMVDLRNAPPKTIGGSKLVSLLDYENRVQTNILTGVKSPIDLPKSDVLQFVTEDGTKISARPSGTEPKIKFYASANLPLASKSDYDKVSLELDKKIEAAMKDLGL
jgi:phosphoglucomutase